MSRRIFFDGLNLALERGTGIATYTRMLTALAHEAGDEVGLVYSSPRRPLRDKRLRALDFIGPRRPGRWVSKMHGRWNDVVDQVECVTGLRPQPDRDARLGRGERCGVPAHDHHLYVARNLFGRATRYFGWSGRFAEIDFPVRPDILHCTYPMPLAAKGARNVYTIHDLIPLRLPHTTLDSKRQMYRLLRRIAATADHIVTVSEHSRRDIIEMLGADEARVTNTYEAVEFPPEMLERPDDIVAGDLMSRYRLEAKTYLLFYGAIEPKKNVKALIEAYQQSGVAAPLVIVGGGGWSNEAEIRMLKAIEAEEAVLAPEKRRVRRLDYADRSALVSLIKGALAVLFPSLFEGFGLPVLEGLMLGTPVVTSKTSSLPEIGGDAALYVDPHDIDDIARAIRTITADADLRAELSRRGRKQAELFSVARYRERVAALYDRLAWSGDGRRLPSFDPEFRARLRDLLVWRRDVRRFRRDPLPAVLVERLIETAALAPSVGLSQPWRFVLVETAERRASIRADFARCNAAALATQAPERQRLYARLKLAGLDDAPCQLAVFIDAATEQGAGLGRLTMPETSEYSAVMAVHTLWLPAARAEGRSAWAGCRSSTRPRSPRSSTCRRSGASSAISASATRPSPTTPPPSNAPAGSTAGRRL